MSTRTSSSAATRTATRRRPSKAARRASARRRLALLIGVVVASAAVIAAVSPLFDKAVQEIRLPLRHDDIIRQQAADKGLDPALIAGVIYTESRFVDQTSHAGAKGLMQIMPATAEYIAGLSGGTRFEQGDLASPQINISYGAYYLRYLQDKYDGDEVLTLAAYNAGEGKVDEWRGGAESLEVDAIPFAETREYVGKVLTARDDYRRQYQSELGL